jgi:hypothetical protein
MLYVVLQYIVGIVTFEHEVSGVGWYLILKEHRVGDEKRSAHVGMVDDEGEARHIVRNEKAIYLEAADDIPMIGQNVFCEWMSGYILGLKDFLERKGAYAEVEHIHHTPCMIVVLVADDATDHVRKVEVERGLDVRETDASLNDEGFGRGNEEIAVPLAARCETF